MQVSPNDWGPFDSNKQGTIQGYYDKSFLAPRMGVKPACLPSEIHHVHKHLYKNPLTEQYCDDY